MTDQKIHTKFTRYCKADCIEHGKDTLIFNRVFCAYVGMDNALVLSWWDRELRLPQYCPVCDGVVMYTIESYIANN